MSSHPPDRVSCPYCSGDEENPSDGLVAAYLLDTGSWLYRCPECGFGEIHPSRIDGEAA